MTMKGGFIGLGIMGKPMSKNLLKAGYSLVVADRNPEAIADVIAAGAETASTAKAIAEQCDVIITMLPNSPHVKEVALGENEARSGVEVGLRPEVARQRERRDDRRIEQHRLEVVFFREVRRQVTAQRTADQGQRRAGEGRGVRGDQRFALGDRFFRFDRQRRAVVAVGVAAFGHPFGQQARLPRGRRGAEAVQIEDAGGGHRHQLQAISW